MKIVKPHLIGCMLRTYDRNSFRLAVTGSVFFSFRDPDRPLRESAMWETIAAELGDGAAWDMGIPKDRAEFLLSARCFSLGGIPVGRETVRVRVGPLSRRLAVFGNRHWKNHSGFWKMTEPEPFSEMPLDWNHAYGGKGFPGNPVGKGFIDGPSDDPVPLPNVEDPDRLVRNRGDRPEPAGLGPVDLTRPQRMNRFGAYRPSEIGKTPPGLPADIDWTFFNQASPEQWLSGPSWTPGETFSIEGLHPEMPRQSGALPTSRIRAFAAFGTREEERFVEIPLSAETVWLFPHREAGIVIHRGSVPVATDDATDVRALLLAAEGPEDRRSPDHYRAVLSSRENRKSDDPERFGDEPLLPSAMIGDPEANLANAKYQREKAMSAFSGKLPDGENAVLEKIGKKFEEAKARFSSALSGNAGEEIGAVMDSVGTAFRSAAPPLPKAPAMPVSPTAVIEEKIQAFLGVLLEKIPASGWEQSGTSPDALREEILAKTKESLSRPPEPKPFPSFDEVVAKTRELGSLSNGTPGESFSEEDRERWEKARRMVEKAAALSTGPSPLAHFMPLPQSAPGSGLEMRMRVEEGRRSGPDFRGWDLRGADLSGLDLSGADFTEADLSGASLAGADLSGARLDKAVLARADLSNSILSGASLVQANLGFAALAGAQAGKADCSKAILQGVNLTGADLSGARLVGANLSNAVFVRVNATRIEAHRVRFLSVPLPEGSLGPADRGPLSGPSGEDNRPLFRETDFSGADLSGALFMDADFEAVRFSGADLSRALFKMCGGTETFFDRARMTRTVFLGSRDFSRSDFRGADLSEGSFRGAPFEGSDFTKARMEGADFSQACLTGAKMRGVKAVKARFIKSELAGADMTGSDFREALFLKADIRGTSFAKSSAYRANFFKARSDRTTGWTQSFLVGSLSPEERS